MNFGIVKPCASPTRAELVERYASAISEQHKTLEMAALQAASLLGERVPVNDARWQALIEKIQVKVQQRHGIKLQPEVRIIGEAL